MKFEEAISNALDVLIRRRQSISDVIEQLQTMLAGETSPAAAPEPRPPKVRRGRKPRKEKPAPAVQTADTRKGPPVVQGGIPCLDCGERFANAQGLGSHRTRTHFNEPSRNRSSIAAG